MTSIEKIRESIDEVLAQVMRSHADQLRNEVSERIRVHLEDDAKQLGGVEQQLRERSEQAQSLEQQLAQTRGEIADKLKHIETLEQQLRDLQNEKATLHGRVGELENTLKSETERLDKNRQELEQLLVLSQEEVKQGQNRETEQKIRLQELEKQIEEFRGEHEKALQSKAQELADKSAEYEQRLESSSKSKTEAVEAKEQELKTRITEIEQTLEKAQSEARERLESKERELLEQVHLLEELLVQGQHAREQQLEAKDREVQETLATQKAEFEARLQEVQAQLADRDKLLQAQGGELQDRILTLEKDLAESQKQLADVRNELKDTQSAFEKAQQQLDELNANLRSRDGDLTSQLGDLEKRLADYSVAEEAWQKREQELLGHRDKVLSSSAEASQAGQKALEIALEDQARLQTQLDAMLEELERVREELQKTHDSYQDREKHLADEIAGLRQELAAHGGGTTASASRHIAPIIDDKTAIPAAIEKVRAARSQTEILKTLLAGAAQFAGRSGIFVVHGRTAAGWANRGFGPDAEFRHLSVECNKGIPARVVKERKYVRGHANEFDHKLVATFGAPKDGHAFVFPLFVRDRVAAFFYADCGTELTHEVSTSSIDTIVKAAGAWLDEIAGKGSASRSTAEASPLPLAITAAAAPAFTEAKVATSAVSMAATAVAPEAAPAGNTDASRQRARRFAKLLVDEIKLYNKDAVEAGRRNNDLYDRLRESIDKSRVSYDKRWGKSITDIDYFREELVRNLAENNAAVFGNNFPR